LEEVIINYYYYTGERRVNVGGAGGKGREGGEASTM